MNTLPTHIRVAAIAAGILGLSVGCDTTMAGSNGYFELSYTNGGLFESVSQPIGAGLTADAVVRPAGQAQAASLDSASSSDESVLTVESLGSGALHLHGQDIGYADVSVTSGDLTDAFTIEVAAVDSVVYGDPIRSDDNPEYAIAAGATVAVERTPQDAARRSLTGYGLGAPSFSPEESAIFVRDEVIGYVSVRFTTAGSITVAHGDDVGATFNVIDPVNVDFQFERLDALGDAVPVDQFAMVKVYGRTEGGTYTLTDLTSTDPAVCTPESLLGSADTYVINPYKPGVCTLFVAGNPELASLSVNIVASGSETGDASGS